MTEFNEFCGSFGETRNNLSVACRANTHTTASRAYGDGFDYSELMESTDL